MTRRLEILVLAMLVGLIVPHRGLPHGVDESGVEFVGADEVRRLQRPPRLITMVDVRSPEEFREARIAGAVNVPLTEIERRFEDVPRQGLVVLY